MLRPAALLYLALGLSGCIGDETLSGYADRSLVYYLVSLDGQAFGGRATLSLPEKGRIEGFAPCNSYFSTQTVPYPWFKTGPIAATKMACPDLARESAYFAALQDMTLAEVSGPVLVLSNDAGREMVFQGEEGGRANRSTNR